MSKKKKIVLAYSGGLDTSVLLSWIKDKHNAEMIAFCADIGQEDELKGLKQKAMKTAAAPKAMKKGIKQKRMQAEQEADEDASEDESERDLDTGKKIVYDPAAKAAIRAALADLLSPAP